MCGHEWATMSGYATPSDGKNIWENLKDFPGRGTIKEFNPGFASDPGDPGSSAKTT